MMTILIIAVCLAVIAGIEATIGRRHRRRRDIQQLLDPYDKGMSALGRTTRRGR